MAITVDAIYENGVLVPAQPLKLAEHEQVRVTIDAVEPLVPPSPEAAERVRQQARDRLQVDPDIALAIATDPSFDLLGE